ncbi:hypothetical protein OC844_000423 [Tilletia horrida]|nr:hypothetical protein OC844_000423 [Tilletia horrida]
MLANGSSAGGGADGSSGSGGGGAGAGGNDGPHPHSQPSSAAAASAAAAGAASTSPILAMATAAGAPGAGPSYSRGGLPGAGGPSQPGSAHSLGNGPLSPSVHVTDWSESHVSSWLHSLGFSHLAPSFREHGINGDSLILLDDDNLQEIGVHSVGQRLALLGEIYRLKETYDIPIEEGDYVPQSAFPTISLPSAAPSEPPASLSHVIQAIQQRNERIAALETELSKVTIYLNRLQQDFAQVCQLVGLQKPSSCDAPPIFPFSPTRADSDHLMALNTAAGKMAAAMGLSASQQALFSGLPGGPNSANPLSAPMTARAPTSAASTLNIGATPFTGRTSSTNGDGLLAPDSALSAISSSASAIPNSNGTTTALPGFGGSDPENTYRSFRVTLDDPCYRVLPAALKKYKINDDWKKYALIICHGNTERCVTYEEKPLLLFQKLKESKQNPIFMLRHIRDVKNPIALAKAKAEARKHTTTGPPVVKVPIKDLGAAGAAAAASASGPSASQSTSALSAETDKTTSTSPKNNKVAQTVARFEQGASASSPRPSTAPANAASGGDAAGDAQEGKDGAAPSGDSLGAGSHPSSAPANSSNAAFTPTSSTTKTGAPSSSKSAVSGHTFVPLGSPEWAVAMAVRALKNGHDPEKPVLTGAATRLQASTTPTTAASSSSSSTALKTVSSSSTQSQSGVSPGAAPESGAASRKFAIAIYPYPSERDDEFDVELGDTFVVLSKIHGWWAVERDPKADGEGDGQYVEVDAPERDGRSGSGGKRRIKVVRTGWVPAGCLLEMSEPLAVAVPTLKEKLEEAGSAAAEGEKRAAGVVAAAGESAANDVAAGEGKTSEGADASGGGLAQPQPQMATFPIPPALITSPSTPGVMLMDYASPPEDRLSLKKNDRLRVFKRYSHWSYCVQEGGSNGRGWVPSWYIGKASASSATSSSSRRTGANSIASSGAGKRTSSSKNIMGSTGSGPLSGGSANGKGKAPASGASAAASALSTPTRATSAGSAEGAAVDKARMEGRSANGGSSSAVGGDTGAFDGGGGDASGMPAGTAATAALPTVSATS